MGCMFKRFAVVAGAVSVLASSAFASWDYFPPKESGGQAKLEYEVSFPAEKVTKMDLWVGARYTIIPGLEASLKVPMCLSSSWDGNSAEDYFGIMYLPVGVRYWLPMGLGFFVDAGIPLGTADWMGDPDFTLDAGVQYSMNITDEFSFGSELKAMIPIADGAEFELGLGLELGYAIGPVAPYLGLDMNFGLPEYADFDIGTLWVGAGYDINEMFSAGLQFNILNIANDADIGFGIAVNASFNF